MSVSELPCYRALRIYCLLYLLFAAWRAWWWEKESVDSSCYVERGEGVGRLWAAWLRSTSSRACVRCHCLHNDCTQKVLAFGCSTLTKQDIKNIEISSRILSSRHILPPLPSSAPSWPKGGPRTCHPSSSLRQTTWKSHFCQRDSSFFIRFVLHNTSFIIFKTQAVIVKPRHHHRTKHKPQHWWSCKIFDKHTCEWLSDCEVYALNTKC